MLEYIFIGAMGAGLVLLYCLINSQGIVCRLLRRAMTRNTKRERCRLYLEKFREHKQNGLGRNIIAQTLPWVMVMVLMVVLSNQNIYFGTVLSGSMEPTFKKDDLVLMQAIDKEPKVGDIIMFSTYGLKEPVSHRVISIDKGKIRTKGDANPTEDAWVLEKGNIMGKAVTVGGQPIVLGIGSILVPSGIYIMNKLPPNILLFQKFRAIAPIILFFGTIFYFFILIETRMEQKRRFNGNGKNGVKNGTNGGAAVQRLH